ncbi:DUF2947 family protein [Gynuella sunshinyii]|uniref:Uncharacterized protein n=1 Tax=Gynuella sunshinyii YC6258 TaxID=1445510 RepID=A0A0C5V5R3_9GAMM|nr:DUF2947 family protein [Gynuella sunshinyii]AJQ94760.1 hypothetical Protein YC6258_02722 [Gynuella sunshinyii YC6258]
MKDFALSWRFTDPIYNDLPEKDLASIVPIIPEQSANLWYRVVSKQSHIHLSDLGNYKYQVYIDTENEESGRKLLGKKILFDDDDDIIFFWSPKCSVITKWHTVKKYWTDFFYPDDDNTVFIGPCMLISYSEEQFFIYTNETDIQSIVLAI